MLVAESATLSLPHVLWPLYHSQGWPRSVSELFRILGLYGGQHQVVLGGVSEQAHEVDTPLALS